MDAHFCCDVAGDGDRRDCRHSDQTHNPKGPAVCEIRVPVGRTAFQHEIPRVSIWSCSGVHRVFWRFDFHPPPCRTRLFADPNSDRVLPNVPRCALPIRCCVCSSAGDSMCRTGLAFFAPEPNTHRSLIAVCRSGKDHAMYKSKGESKTRTFRRGGGEIRTCVFETRRAFTFK